MSSRMRTVVATSVVSRLQPSASRKAAHPGNPVGEWGIGRGREKHCHAAEVRTVSKKARGISIAPLAVAMNSDVIPSRCSGDRYAGGF